MCMHIFWPASGLGHGWDKSGGNERGNEMGTLSIWHWLIVLLIVALVFGTKKLRNIGTDLGAAVKGFKEGMRDGDAPPSSASASTMSAGRDREPPVVIEAEVKDRSARND